MGQARQTPCKRLAKMKELFYNSNVYSLRRNECKDMCVIHAVMFMNLLRGIRLTVLSPEQHLPISRPAGFAQCAELQKMSSMQWTIRQKYR